MRNRTFMAGTALAAITLIAFLALWRDITKTTDVGLSSAVRSTAAPRSSSTLPPAPPAGLSRLDEMVQELGNHSEQTTQIPDPAIPSRPAPEPVPSTGTLTTPAPGSPIKDATEGAVGMPAAEATVNSEPGRPARPTAAPATASMSPRAVVSGSASDKVARMQLAARMQGLEPGPPIPLPLRLNRGQARTIYFFTELRGLSGRSVIHRWEWNGRMMQERKLRPASQSWRAYTAMTITADMQGSWRISTVDAMTGKVLAEQRFKVE